MKDAILVTTLLVQTLLGGSLILTILMPRYRVWPPPKRASWQYVYTWGLTLLSFAGILAVAILDWNSLALSQWLRFGVGIPIVATSVALVLWAVRTLGANASQGLGGQFIQQGPYRFTRNPQYVADIAMLGGFAILSGSMLALPACLLAIAWFALAPFAEEPWLRERYGTEYDDYARQIPRFVGH